MSRDLPDSDVVAAACSGEPLALRRLVDDCLPVVLGWCKRLSGPYADPEDAAHDVLIVVLDRITVLRDPRAFPRWLFQITRRTLATHRRRAWIRRWLPDAFVEPADPGPGPERLHQQDELARMVQHLLDQLPDKLRTTLVLHDLEQRSDSEVAAMLNIPRNTVKSRLRLGRRRFLAIAREQDLHAPLQGMIFEGAE